MFVEGGRSGARGDGEISAIRSGREKVRIRKVTENQYAGDSIDPELENSQDVHHSHFVIEGRRCRSLSKHFEMTDALNPLTTLDKDTLLNIPLWLT